jgi:hypothetical protein
MQYSVVIAQPENLNTGTFHFLLQYVSSAVQYINQKHRLQVTVAEHTCLSQHVEYMQDKLYLNAVVPNLANTVTGISMSTMKQQIILLILT